MYDEGDGKELAKVIVRVYSDVNFEFVGAISSPFDSEGTRAALTRSDVWVWYVNDGVAYTVGASMDEVRAALNDAEKVADIDFEGGVEMGRHSPVKCVPHEGGFSCTLYKTTILTYDFGVVTLRTDGWKTPTTKRWLNRLSLEYDFGFRVFQEDWVWYVRLPTSEVVEFTEGMTFNL